MYKSNIILIIIALSVITSSSFSQIKQGSFECDYLNKAEYGGRVRISIMDYNTKDSSTNLLGFSFQLFAFTKIPREDDHVFSSNLLFFLPCMVSAVIEGLHEGLPITKILILPFLIPNSSISFPIKKDNLYLKSSLHTDFYIKRIYSEIAFSFIAQYMSIVVEPFYAIPFSKGYFSNRNPYVGLSVGLLIK